MKTLLPFTLLLASLVFAPSSVMAQQSPRQSVVGNFEKGSPALGERLPDISGFDAKGNEFHLRSLKGNYTVLVFGCLT